MTVSKENYLPDITGLKKGPRKGRSVYDGYQRGWGLQFGDLRENILQDPLYRDAMQLAKKRTLLAELNRMNLFLLLKFNLSSIPKGHIIEFGSYLGGNAIFMAYVANQLYPNIKVFALDSFTGMPETDKAVDAHNEGDFSGVDLEELRDYVDRIGLKNLEFRKGLFEETAKDCLACAGSICLAHIDCDIYPSVKYAYQAVKPYMVADGYIVFDDATVSSCIGATEVVEDLVIREDRLNSEQIYPHFVFRSRR